MENKEFCFRVNLSKIDNQSTLFKLEKQVEKLKKRINEKFNYKDSHVYYEIGIKFKDMEEKKFRLKICYK